MTAPPPSEDATRQSPGPGGTAEMHEGGCLCGAVRWRVVGPLRPVIACHCIQCRKTSGHHVAMTSAGLDRFTLVRDDGLAWYESSPAATRGFCRVCGGNIFWKPTGGERISIAAGSIDGPSGLAIQAHIFCDFAGDYYTIADDAPHYPESD